MKNKQITKRIVALVMTMLIVVTGLIVVSSGATVAKDVTTWSELKTEVEKLKDGDVATFNITKRLTAVDDSIKINEGVTVNLVCAVDGHTNTDVDIGRGATYHGNFFVARKNATLNVQCCMSGYAFSSGEWRGFFNTTSADKRGTSVDEYYGEALIYGYNNASINLIGGKAVLKHNYNPYSNKSGEPDYKQYFHRSSGVTGWSTKQVTFPDKANSEGSHNEKTDSMKGGAIYCKSGAISMKSDSTGTPRIYDCIAEYGGAICFEGYSSDDNLQLYGGYISNCIARQYGGGVYAVIEKTETGNSNNATWDNFNIGTASGNNTDIVIQDNRAPQGGGVYSDIRIDFEHGTIQNNQATGRFSDATDGGLGDIALVGRGGGIYITGTSNEAVYGKGTFNLKDGIISNNEADSGAGVYLSGTAGTMNMSGGKITGNQAGALNQGSLEKYREITTVNGSAVIYPKDGNNDGFVDYYDSVRAGNFYDTDAAEVYESDFALYILKEKYILTLLEEKIAAISTDTSLGAAADRDKLLSLLEKSVDNGGLYYGNETVDGVEYRLYKPITLYFENSSDLKVTYGNSFYSDYYIGLRADSFDSNGIYSDSSSDTVVFGKYNNESFVPSKTVNIYWEGPYVDDKVSFFGVEYKTTDDFVYDETQELAADELTTASYYNTSVAPRFFTTTAITNEELYDKYSDYIGLGGGICSGTDVNITGGTIGGENVIGLDFEDAKTLGTITDFKGNISYKSGGGIYMNGGTLTINGKNASVEGNLTDENGGGIFVQSRSSDDVDGVLKFLRGTVANNRATLNYNPASGSKAGGGSGGGIYLAMTAQPSVIGVEGAKREDWPQIYGNECLNYGGGVHSFVRGTVTLNKDSSGGYDITTPGLTINNANIYHNKTGLNFRDGLNYSSGGGVSSNGALWIKDGNISCNFSNSNGAGVYCTQYRANDSYPYSRGAFKMTGGTIENNGRWAYDYESTKVELFPGWTVPIVKCDYAQTEIGGGLYSTTYGQPIVLEGSPDNLIQVVGNHAYSGGGIFSNRWAHRMSVDTNDSKYSSSNDGYADYGTELIYCNISNNEAINYGGGVGLGTSCLFENCVVSENTTDGNGGGIRVGPVSVDFIDVVNTKIYNNTAKGNGGGIYNYGIVNLISAEIYGNKAAIGGGVCNSPYSSGGLVHNDKVYYKVGSASFQYYDGYSKQIFAKLNINAKTLGDVKIYDNEATSGAGGGVYFSTEGEPGTINNALIYNNTAKTYGGGICSYRSNTKTFTYPDASSSEYTTTTTSSGVSLKNTEIYGNTAGSESGSGNGAGIYWGATSKLNIDDTISIYNNTAKGDGGGVYLNKGTLNMTGGSVNDNTSEKGGAGIYSNALLTVSGGKIYNNTASGQGGGVAVWLSNADIGGAEIYGNSAKLGGGVFNNASATINNTQIYENTASENGGGVLISNSATSTEVNGCYIYKNKAAFGGGVFDHSRTSEDEGLRIGDSFIYENEASIDGGGVYVSHATKSVADSVAIISNTEIYSNSAVKGGGGVYNYGRTRFVDDTKIYSNTANYGGGLYIPNENNDIDTVLEYVAFYQNEATYGGAISNACSYVPLDINSEKVHIYKNNGKTYGGGIYNTGTVNVGKAVIDNNTAGNGGAIYNALNLNLDGTTIKNNTATTYGGGIADWGSNASLNVKDSKIYQNGAYEGGGIYAATAGKEGIITNSEIYENTARTNGGAISNNKTAGLTITDVRVYDNTASTNGGGIYSNGLLNIESGYVYNNTKSGVYVNNGTTTVNGGFYGLSAYTNDSNYTVSRNEVAQITTGTNGTVNVTGKNKIRVVSELTNGESIDANVGIKNAGVFTVEEACEDFDIYGTGTGVSNTGTFNANGTMRITTSKKDGSTTLQNRLGVLNGSTGVVNLNSDSVEIAYCSARGVNNQGVFNFAKGSIHDCTIGDTKHLDSIGAGVYNNGNNSAFNMSGGEVYNNSANTGAGVYLTSNVKESAITGGIIQNNTAHHGGGVYNLSTAGLTIKGGEISNNIAVSDEESENIEERYAYGGGIHNGGKLVVVDGKINNNSATSYGGGVYNGGNNASLEMTGGTISGNTAGSVGGGVYNNNIATLSGNNVHIYKNNAVSIGGGIYSTGTKASLNMTECCVYENSSATGAGIYCMNNSNLTGVQVYNNDASSVGGGIAVGALASEGVVNIVECDINGNKAVIEGGGVYVTSTNGSVNVLDSEIHKNVATKANSGMGGGVLNAGNINYTNTKIYENNAFYGAGMLLRAGTVNMENCEVNNNGSLSADDNNVVTTQGGGIRVNKTDNKTIAIKNSTISGNTAQTGGGIVINNGDVTINQNSKISENVTSGQGAGIRIDNGATLTLSGVDVYNNTADSYGGGAYVVGVLNLQDNTKIYNNTASIHGGGIFTSGGAELNTTRASIYSNEATSYGGGIYWSANTDLTVADGLNIYENKAESGGGIYVINANSKFSVTGGKICNNSAEKLGGGIMVYKATSNSFSGGEIYGNIAKSTGGGIHTQSNTGVGTTTISGNVKIYNNSSGEHGGGVSVGQKLVMTGGEIYGNTTTNHGGGIFVNVVCEASEITGGLIGATTDADGNIVKTTTDADGNTVSLGNTAGAGGGGIATATLNGLTLGDNVKVCNNTAGAGGGVYTYGVLNLAGAEIYENTASNIGGGIWVDRNGSCLNMTSGKVYSNEAVNGGGGIYISNVGDLCTFTGGEVYGNTTKSYGGGIFTARELTIVDGMKIYENNAYVGGGVYLTGENSKLNMTGGHIYSNIARNNGGGIYLSETGLESGISGGIIGGSTTDKDGNVIPLGNKATYGGGVYNARKTGLTISGGEICNNTAENDGGGICSIGPLSVSDVTVCENNAGCGGGVSLNSTYDTSFTNVHIYSNTANDSGGAVYVYNKNTGNVTFTNCVFGGAKKDAKGNTVTLGNTAKGLLNDDPQVAEGGGGLFLHGAGTITITGCELSYNNSVTEGQGNGGGIYVLQKLNLNNTKFFNNTSDGFGGGIAVHVYGTVNVGENVSFYKNEAGAGGGVYNTGTWNESETLTQKTGVKIFNNTATHQGGGIFNQRNYVSYNTEIYENNAENGGGAFSEKNFTFNNALIHDNTSSSSGGGVASSTNSVLVMNDSKLYLNTASSEGGAINCASTSKDVTLTDCEIYQNVAGYAGGAIRANGTGVTVTGSSIHDNTASSGGAIINYALCNINGVDIYKNGNGVYDGGTVISDKSATYGGAICNSSGGTLNVNDRVELTDKTETKIHDNFASTNGGGIYSEGTVIINNAYVYNNNKRGVMFNKGVATINGGFYGFSAYADDSNYSVSRNIDAQIAVGSNATCTVTGKNTTRVVSEYAEDKDTVFNESIRNAGTFIVDESCKEFDIYGTGISVDNSGTFTSDGVFRIVTSEKDGSNVVQNRIGIVNTGTVNINKVGSLLSPDVVEIAYCENRGIENKGVLNIADVKIHNNSTVNMGAGIFNDGVNAQLNMTGGKVYNNISGFYGGAIHFTANCKPSVISNSEIYENVAEHHGGGISALCQLDVSDTLVHDNTTGFSESLGGGVFVGPNGVVNMSGSEVYNNKSTLHGGGVYVNSDGTFNMSSGEIHNNSAVGNGGGVYVLGTASLNVTGGEIYNNNGVRGGGVFNVGKTSIENAKVYENNASELGGGVFGQGAVTINNSEIYQNTASNSGGGVASIAEMTIDNTIIRNNVAVNGGGIKSSTNCVFKINNSSIYENEATGAGGAMSIDSVSKSNVVTDSEIYNNTAPYGGAIWNGATNGITIENSKIHNNVATSEKYGGGAIYNIALVNIVNGSDIYENAANTYGGAITNNNANAILNIEDSVKIHNNEAKTNGGGICINSGVTNMVGGTVYDNDGAKGDGVYLTSAGTFKMSETAIVEDSDVVYLEKDAYISVPSAFTGDQNIRANISGVDMVTGRVVAKHTPESENVDALGTVALYHDSEEPDMTAQYFALVNGKMLRAGNQGASVTVPELISDEDVFITEGYSVNFDMNTSFIENLINSVTHVIDDEDCNDNDHEGEYSKYWNEELTFNPGHAESDDSEFNGWNTMNDGSGNEYLEDEDITLDGTFNEDITYYAQWLTERIDVNYLGNGATKGNDFTEKDVDGSEDTYTLDDGVVNGKEEQDASGIDEDGKPVFERVEEVREVVTDENGNPVIDEETGEEVTVVTQTKLFSFEGWSFAETPDAQNRVMNLGETIRMNDLKAHLNNANTNTFSLFNMRSIEQADGTNDNSYVDIYAAWDQYPTIYAVDRYFTLEEAQAGKITLEELMDTEHAFACDGYDKDGNSIPKLDEDGNAVTDEFGDTVPLWEGQNTNFYDTKKVQATDKDGNLLFDDEGNAIMVDEFIKTDEESFTILDYVAEDFTSLKSSASKTLTFCAVDRAGNMTIKTITVYVTDNSDTDASFFSRFISEKYFKDAEGNFVLEENGGFNEKSNWITKVDYVALLESVFANEKDEDTGEWDTVYEVWTWDVESIAEAKQFVEDEGLGNVEQNNALEMFRTRFGPVKTN